MTATRVTGVIRMEGRDSCEVKYLVILIVAFVSIVHTQDSPHGNLEMQCIECHSTEGWDVIAVPMKFNHSSTQFVLYGQHRNTACKQCHTNLRFAGTPMNCVACHQNDFDAALSINHRKAGFGTDCLQCHTVDALTWKASFDHNKTQFPTRGIHEAISCETCHVNDLYQGISLECVSCHLKEYNATKNPNHQTAKFPTDCATCHRALTWQPAVFFPHDEYFPIGSGARHSPGRWNSCVDCHAASPNYAVFECINCHEHSQARTDGRHGEVSGYVYQSQACYRCHPSGQAGG
ncbi:MAG: hypothetical protein PHP42_03800 [Bacteroidota bacterium]|nr:hypothetical protein [Bacteroidota bacterium]